MEAIGIELNTSNMFGESTVSIAYSTGDVTGKLTGPWTGDLATDTAKLFAAVTPDQARTLAAHARALVDALVIAAGD